VPTCFEPSAALDAQPLALAGVIASAIRALVAPDSEDLAVGISICVSGDMVALIECGVGCLAGFGVWSLPSLVLHLATS
jgi:hypothetical protein